MGQLSSLTFFQILWPEACSKVVLLNCYIKWLEFASKNGLKDLSIKCVDGVIADYALDLMQEYDLQLTQ